MAYKPSKQMEWEKSPIFNAKMYRKPETVANEEILDDFIFFLEYDYSPNEYDKTLPAEPTPEQIKYIEALTRAFLNYNIDKVAAGEQELYQQWIKASG